MVQRKFDVIFAIVLLLLSVPSPLLCGDAKTQESKSNVLWYQQPAKNWNEALPVGNGRLGGMVFGMPSVERIQLNEESLWSGSKIPNNNPGALEHLSEIRQLILKGEIPKAFEISEKYISGIPGKIRSYQVLANLFFLFDDTLG
ncbi:MAG: hypothetical protein EHM64_09555, partial [Ignavibacteriae bacterium]